MKKIFKVFVLSFIVLFLVGCGKNDELKDLNGKVKSNFTINETGVYKGIEYRVTDFNYKRDAYDESAGEQLLVEVIYEVKNSNDKEIKFNEPMCFLYEDGEEVNEYYGDPENEITTLEPERTYVIKYSFVVKSEESKLKFMLVLDEPDDKSIQMNVEYN